MVSHKEFEGRARHGKTTCIDCTNDNDENGHGTHVAAIAGGKTFGVANKINLVAVKVLNKDGSGSYSDIIAGLAFVLAEHKANPKQNSVVKCVLYTSFFIYFCMYKFV